MSCLFWSRYNGCVGGPGLSCYLESFDHIPEAEFFDDIDYSILFVPDFPFDDMEVDV